MGLEIEAKIRVDSHDAVRAALRATGATYLHSAVESDCLFDRADGSLRARAVALRLREVRFVEPIDPVVVMTVKGPAGLSRVKAREELELTVPDIKQASRMLELLGFMATLTVEKSRETWRHGDCVVALDEVPSLGRFVEIEGPDERTVLEVQRSLGLGDREHLGSAYATMIAEHQARECRAASDRRPQ